MIIASLTGFFAHNQLFSGLAGAGAVAGLMYWVRALPARLMRAIQWGLSFEIEISNDCDPYPAALSWISARGVEKWCNRSFKVVNAPSASTAHLRYDGIGDPAEWMLSLGMGRHWMSFERRPICVSREVTNPEHASGNYVREVIRVRLFTLNRKRITRLVDKFREAAQENADVAVHLWRTDHWNLIDRRRPRPIESVVLSGNMMAEISSDATRFFESEAWYIDRGIPYRRGYLFSGAPGTGKTSTAMVLAGVLRVPVYVLNFGSILSDNALIDAISAVPRRSILLIEDIDTANIPQDINSKISLSAILNVIDGVMSRDGRLLILTANEIGELPQALLRPGRVDRRFDFGLIDGGEVASLYERFFPTRHDLSGRIRQARLGARTAASIQAVLLEHAGDAEAAATALIEPLSPERL